MEKFTDELEIYNIQREISDKSTQRRKKMRPPREAYLFIPNEFQIIEENKEKPSKSLRRIFEGNFEFNQYEKSKLKELYTEIEKKNAKSKNVQDKLQINQLKEFDVLRLLQATCFKVEETIKLLSAHISWRNEKLPNFSIKSKSIEILERGFIYVHGRDLQYRPILVVNACVYMRIKDQYCFDDWENFIIFFMTYLIENLVIPGQVENWLIITDVRGVSLYSLPSDFKKLMGVLSSNYRCRLFVNYIFGMSPLLNFIWKLIQYFLDETAKKKIKFINDANKNEIFKYIHKSQIEKKYGGDAEDKITEFFPGFMPSGQYLLESQNKVSYLIAEEEYGKLCRNGKIKTINQEILNDLEKDVKKIPILIDDKHRTIGKGNIGDFNLLTKTINPVFEENYKLEYKPSAEGEHFLKYNNSFNLLSQNPSLNLTTPVKDKNEEIFKIIQNVQNEFGEYGCERLNKIDSSVSMKVLNKEF